MGLAPVGGKEGDSGQTQVPGPGGPASGVCRRPSQALQESHLGDAAGVRVVNVERTGRPPRRTGRFLGAAEGILAVDPASGFSGRSPDLHPAVPESESCAGRVILLDLSLILPVLRIK